MFPSQTLLFHLVKQSLKDEGIGYHESIVNGYRRKVVEWLSSDNQLYRFNFCSKSQKREYQKNLKELRSQSYEDVLTNCVLTYINHFFVTQKKRRKDSSFVTTSLPFIFHLKKRGRGSTNKGIWQDIWPHCDENPVMSFENLRILVLI